MLQFAVDADDGSDLQTISLNLIQINVELDYSSLRKQNHQKRDAQLAACS
jgi:hypothetical protein